MEKSKVIEMEKVDPVVSTPILIAFRFLTFTTISAFFSCIVISIKNNWIQSTGKRVSDNSTVALSIWKLPVITINIILISFFCVIGFECWKQYSFWFFYLAPWTNFLWSTMHGMSSFALRSSKVYWNQFAALSSLTSPVAQHHPPFAWDG